MEILCIISCSYEIDKFLFKESMNIYERNEIEKQKIKAVY